MGSSIYLRVAAPVVLAAAIGLGCSSSSSDDSGGDTDTSSCSIALSGAVTATDDCSGVPLTDFTTATGVGSFSLEHSTTDASLPSSLAVIYFNGVPTVGTTYTISSAGAEAGSSVHQNSDGWEENLGFGEATAGSFTLKFTSVVVLSSNADATYYTAHGSLTVVLPAHAGNTNTGTVTLTAAF